MKVEQADCAHNPTIQSTTVITLFLFPNLPYRQTCTYWTFRTLRQNLRVALASACYCKIFCNFPMLEGGFVS